LRLSWSSVPGATAYHVLVGDEGFFLDPLVDQRGLTSTTFAVEGLREGTYYWRVSAVGEDHVEGPPSDVTKITVVRPERLAAAPTLRVSEVELRMHVLHVRGA